MVAHGGSTPQVMHGKKLQQTLIYCSSTLALYFISIVGSNLETSLTIIATSHFNIYMNIPTYYNHTTSSG